MNSLMERHVAIKFYNNTYAEDRQAIENEVRILDKIDHSGVV